MQCELYPKQICYFCHFGHGQKDRQMEGNNQYESETEKGMHADVQPLSPQQDLIVTKSCTVAQTRNMR